MPDVPPGAQRVCSNDVYVDTRGLIYLVDRNRGLSILERTWDLPRNNHVKFSANGVPCVMVRGGGPSTTSLVPAAKSWMVRLRGPWHGEASASLRLIRLFPRGPLVAPEDAGQSFPPGGAMPRGANGVGAGELGWPRGSLFPAIHALLDRRQIRFAQAQVGEVPLCEAVQFVEFAGVLAPCIPGIGQALQQGIGMGQPPAQVQTIFGCASGRKRASSDKFIFTILRKYGLSRIRAKDVPLWCGAA